MHVYKGNPALSQTTAEYVAPLQCQRKIHGAIDRILSDLKLARCPSPSSLPSRLCLLCRRSHQLRSADYILRSRPSSRPASQGSQCRAAALARSFLAQSARKSFISALSPRMRGATPLYFFVVPVTVRLTVP